MSEPVPRLDLAPRLRRRLQPWNPLDYLRLLYWVFFFPQALRWYEQTFADPQYRGIIGRRDPVRNLVMMELLLMLSTSPAAAITLQLMGVSINWGFVTVIFLILVGIAVSILRIGVVRSDVASSIAGLVAFGVAVGVVGNIAIDVVFGMVFNSFLFLTIGASNRIVFNQRDVTIDSIILGMAFSIVFSVRISISRDLANNIVNSIISNILSGLVLGILISIIIGISFGIIFGVTFGMLFGTVFVVAFTLIMLRLPDYLLLALPTWFSWSRCTVSPRPWLPRMTVIPIPGLRAHLERWLMCDWSTGVHNVNQILAYSLQFIPAVAAVNRALARLSAGQIIPAAAELARDPFDWDLVRFGAVPLRRALWREVIDSFDADFLPRQLRQRWMDRFSLTPALDTSARAACAGFWHLAQKDAAQAAQAFAVVRDLPSGEACYRLARALALAQRCSSFGDLAALGMDDLFLTATQPPDGDPLAQRETWHALARLRRAAQEAHTVQMSVSRLVRSQALNRALAEVNEIVTGVEQIPRAERELVRAIATTWRDLLLNTTAEVGQAAPTQPVRNPYITGDPVIGKGLVGRDDVLRRLEELWYGSASPPSVVIFGHRRMGKTSILRNLDGRLGSRVHVAYVNLLVLGDLRNGAADLFVKLADSIADIFQHKQLPAPTVDDAAFDRRPELAFERYLKQVGAILNEQRLIIALDEFEQLEEWITNNRLPTDIMKTLRGYIQMDERIAFAFAGLHTLEEMSSNYFQPFFASVIPVKVSFLSRGAIDQVLANPPDPEFALDYEREALDDIYALTNGQPYLVQLIGHRLVSRFNDLTFEQGKAQEPRFRRADVEAVITSDFFDQARYYFTVVWDQARHGAPEQQTILRCLASHPDGLPLARLCEISGLPERTVDQALQTLCRHDVVHNHDGQWRYTVELFRRWVEQSGWER